jgi:hypothetical protein
MPPGGLAEIVTLTGKSELTAMITAFEVAGLPVGQVAFDVKTQAMTSPFTRAASV